MDHAELAILRRLDVLVRETSTRQTLDAAVLRVERKLLQDCGEPMAWEPVPLSAYGEAVPDTIRSSWVFVLRAGATTGAERHPNSHQRMMSYRGAGDLQTRTTVEWHSNLLFSDPDAHIARRWMSIPPNTWHQAVVPDENWAVVSFHTASEDELTEERPDETDAQQHVRRLYGHGSREPIA